MAHPARLLSVQHGRVSRFQSNWGQYPTTKRAAHSRGQSQWLAKLQPGGSPLGRGIFYSRGNIFSSGPSHLRTSFSNPRRIMRTKLRIGQIALGIAAVFLQWNNAAAQNSYFQRNLVSDIAGMAEKTDTNLVNPWGIATSASSPFWVSDNHAGVSTLYDGNGTASALIVTIPPPSGGTPPAAPTGVVFNSSTNFQVSPGAAARFIFATEDGTIVGWNSGSSGIIKADNSASGAIYKGLGIGVSGGSNYLYAANFFAGTVDVFDQNYAAVTLPGNFLDPT